MNMLLHNLKIALRNILKYKVQTLGSILSGLCLFWYVPLAYMLGRIRHIFENSRFQKWMHRCTGLVFIAFGLKLATAQAGAE